MPLKPIADSDDAFFDRLIAVNLKGTFNGLREAARRLRNGGHIVNFSTSVIGLRLETYGVYAATKSAVETLTAILSKDLRGRSITVNAIDVIVTSGAAATLALQQATQTIPLVFTGGGDAVINSLVQNIARPEGNTTGFSSSESTVGGKWLELLKAAAPRLVRVVIVFNPELARASPSFLASIEPAARTLAVQTVKAPFRDAVELVRSIDAFAAEPNGGLLMLPPPFIAERATILKLAAQHRLPAIYPQRALTAEGGLISYGADPVDQYRRTASYVDRILRGAKIADLPVQFPTKYKLVVNLKTAKAIGLTIPEPFLLHADELIE